MKIFFKALTKETATSFKWTKGIPTYDYDGSGKITGIDTGKEYYPIIPETLCQSIGKIDKKGQEVFEKDILKFSRKIGKQTIEEELTVYFSEEASQFVVGKSGCMLPLHMYNVAEGEVIGNENNEQYLKKATKRKTKK